MHRLQESLSLRFAGWILFLIALFTSVFYGCQTLIALPYVNLNSIEDTDAFYLLIKEHEDRLIEYTNCMLSLEQEDLSYVEKQRYQNQMNRIQEEMQQQKEAATGILPWTSPSYPVRMDPEPEELSLSCSELKKK